MPTKEHLLRKRHRPTQIQNDSPVDVNQPLSLATQGLVPLVNKPQDPGYLRAHGDVLLLTEADEGGAPLGGVIGHRVGRAAVMGVGGEFAGLHVLYVDVSWGLLADCDTRQAQQGQPEKRRAARSWGMRLRSTPPGKPSMSAEVLSVRGIEDEGRGQAEMRSSSGRGHLQPPGLSCIPLPFLLKSLQEKRPRRLVEARLPGGVTLSYKADPRVQDGTGRDVVLRQDSPSGTQVLLAPASSSAGCRHHPLPAPPPRTPTPGAKGSSL